jgi:alpha-L-fucosidase
VYDFHRFEKVAVKLQPNAVIFSDIGPGCRWAGNERGLILTETNWCTLDTAGFQRGLGAPHVDTLNQGNVNGTHWIPAECDVSIRPGWFYHPDEDEKVKTPEQLWDIYLRSVGRGANLILNVPPDRRGRIHERDSAALVTFGKKVKEAFDENLAEGKPSSLGKGRHWFNAGITDENRNTFAEFDAMPEESFFEIDFKKKKTFNTLIIREKIDSHGQRVQAFKIEILEKNKWREVAGSTTIGARKILSFRDVKARKLRIVVQAAKAPPVISDVQIFRI